MRSTVPGHTEACQGPSQGVGVCYHELLTRQKRAKPPLTLFDFRLCLEDRALYGVKRYSNLSADSLASGRARIAGKHLRETKAIHGSG